MAPPGIEQSLRTAVDEEKRRNGENHIAVAHRLNDLAKYLASQKRFSDAEPIMAQAVFVVAYNTLKAGLPKPPEEAAPIIEGYEILLKVLGVDRDERMASLRATMDRAHVKVNAGRSAW
jgi:hypothetical protein